MAQPSDYFRRIRPYYPTAVGLFNPRYRDNAYALKLCRELNPVLVWLLFFCHFRSS